MKQVQGKQYSKDQRLYQTEAEERAYRQLKKRYGFKDALVVRAESDEESSKQLRSQQSRTNPAT